MGLMWLKGFDFSEDKNESSDNASNEWEVSLGCSGVAIFPFEFSKGAGCIGDVKGDPIGDRLNSLSVRAF